MQIQCLKINESYLHPSPGYLVLFNPVPIKLSWWWIWALLLVGDKGVKVSGTRAAVPGRHNDVGEQSELPRLIGDHQTAWTGPHGADKFGRICGVRRRSQTIQKNLDHFTPAASITKHCPALLLSSSSQHPDSAAR